MCSSSAESRQKCQNESALILARGGPLVRGKRVQQTLQALRGGFQEAGKPLDEVTLEFARKIARDKRFQQLFIAHPEQVAAASAVAGVLLVVEANDTVPTDKFDKFLETIKRELPYGLRAGMQKRMKEAVRAFPSTGRTELLSVAKQKKACDLVGKYHRGGDSMRAAYERVARAMNCSPRTVQRAWTQRRKAPKLSQNAIQLAKPLLDR